MNIKKINSMKHIIYFFFLLPCLFAEDKITEDRLKKIHSILEDEAQENLAPDFSLNSYNDSLYTLSELNGKVVLINFWATWCGPCRMEIPEFNELYDKYHEDGFEILSISISDSKKQLVDFSKVYKVKYPLLYGSLKDIDTITRKYGGIYAVPQSFLIDSNGKIIYKFPGAILKEWDPLTYQKLITGIESEIKIINSN